ncbi:hypothetical protein EPI10_031377 [Gossypium australe]|uniref:Retrotransposon gag protein n=1 Tax=Gossypium australe TaxID=47621 RepID=A0A5B6X063_9ROSI|nr:hypothetical protein EPI10_031377 [Gossypium australe]
MHGFQHWSQMEMFYNGLNAHARMEKIANNDFQYSTTSVSTNQISSLTKIMKTLKRPTVVQEMEASKLTCVYCGEDHVFDECPSNLASVCYMGSFIRNNNPYPDTYDPGWKQHPNFSWSNQGMGNSNNVIRQNVTSAPPEYNPPMPQQNVQQSSSSSSSMEVLLKEYIRAMFQAVSLRALENQVGQIASALSSRPQGALPRDIENSRSQGKEHCKSITLRSGTQLPRVVNDVPAEEDNLNFTHEESSESIVEQSTIEKSKQKF